MPSPFSLPDIHTRSCTENQVQTLVYGEKQVPIKVLEIERKLISSFRTRWIEQRFSLVIRLNEVFDLFFTYEFKSHFYAKIFANTYDHYVVYSAKADVLGKAIKDFNCGLHSREFSVLQTGVKLHGEEAKTSDEFFPLKTFDLLIQGTFEF